MTLIERIKKFSGVKYEDLRYDSDEDLEEEIQEMIDETIDYLNMELNQVYSEEDLPSGLNRILIQIIGNFLREQSMRQDTPVIDNENYMIRFTLETIITNDIKARLKPYRNRLFGMALVYDPVQEEEDLAEEDD